MLVGICDDEAAIQEQLIRLCMKYKETNINDLETVCFSSGDELLKFSRPLDILFLDIQMRGLNGLKTAEKIREKDDSMIIIFLTGYRGYMQQGYRVRAFRYLIKPVIEQEFMKTLSEAVKDITRNYKAIAGMNGETYYIKLQDIIYIEYTNRCSLIRTRKSEYRSPITLNEWEGILNNGDFYRTHKAYIVNLAYIEEIGKEILLDNGEKVELSARQAGKVKKACREYRKRNAR